MDRTERFYIICKKLARGRAVPMGWFLDKFEIKRATFHRDLEYLKDRLNAPIEYERKARGYRFNPGAERFELPGFWFTASEAHAMLAMHQLLDDAQPGLLRPLLQPLYERLQKNLGKKNADVTEMRQRIRILSMAQRKVEPNYFELISHAVLARKRITIVFYNRERDDITTREVSPQRLVHYRDNWYLDAHDHMRSGLRTFSLDCIRDVKLTQTKARNILASRLDQELGQSYGIFAGRPTQIAVLRFNPVRARWVAQEQWHPQQHGERQTDGTYQLEIPYGDDRELLMDILKYGADVEVLAPKNLRSRVRDEVQKMAKNYQK